MTLNTQGQKFSRALLILNSLLVPVFILFVIDALNLSFLLRFGFIYIIIIISVLKIYAMSALAGSILEIISGEEYVVRIRRAHQNAMDLWPGFLIVFLMLRLIDFSLFAVFPAWHSWRIVYSSMLEMIAAFALAQWAIGKKYTKPLGIPHRPFKFSFYFVSVILGTCLAEVILGIFLNSHTSSFYGKNVLVFMFSYIHVFEFIFCSLGILDNYPQIKEKFISSKEIFLINPMAADIVQSFGFRIFVPWHPPAFVVLKALTPKTYKFREFNQVIWHERYYKNNGLVCITSFTTNCYEAYKIAKEFKKRGAKVVMGGPHVTYLPNEALAFCDSVIIGQAEGVWRQVISDYEQGTLKSQYKGPANEEDYALVHQELLNAPPNITKDFLETTRGCKFRCHFCSVPALSGGQVRTKSINDIIDLVKKLKPHYPLIKFIDNNIYSDPGYAKELFVALKPLNIKWKSACTIDIAKNEETLKLARESGCDGLFFGYEVSGGSLEKNQGGKFAMAQKYVEYTQIIKKSGIKIAGSFIFGFDSDNLRSFFQLWKFGFSVMPDVSHVAMLTPLPGSVLFREMLTKDRIINMNWRSHDYNRLVVRHPNMDHRWVSFLFPALRIFFLVTTNFSGLMVLVIILFLPFEMCYSFLR